MKKQLREFLFAFTWMLSCEVIVADLGIYNEGLWGKYLAAAVLGLAWTFYFHKLFEKKEVSKQQN